MLKNNLQLLMSPLCAHLDCTLTEPSHIAIQLNLQVFFPYSMICTPIIRCINIPVVNFMPFVLFVTTYSVYFKKLPVIKKFIFLKLKPKFKIFESHCTYFIIISPTVLSKLEPVSLPPSLPTLWSSSVGALSPRLWYGPCPRVFHWTHEESPLIQPRLRTILPVTVFNLVLKWNLFKSRMLLLEINKSILFYSIKQ